MLLREPGQTPYDLKFNVLGFPCRVHPAFFILPVLFSQGFLQIFDVNAGLGVIIVAAVFFISVLVHELGHTLAFRYFGIDSHVVLYWMGGLAIPGGSGGMGSWKAGRTRSLKPNEQIIVSLAGPIAGLLLAALFVVVIAILTGGVSLRWAGPFPLPQYSVDGSILADSQPLHMFIWVSVVINVVLNIFNLLPVFPLDGGQVARQLFVKADPWAGVRKSTILSLCVAVFIALFSLQRGDTFLAIFFGFMAYSNYQSMLMGGGGGFGGGGGNRRPW
ncbi:metalloprotease [Mariniblastus fucicola]|uniref:Peptidase family M50 n=1 Tax=Mariniblastus fucicola TaxID=980251 RepID=A0A5B9PDF6_9BACT|nr:site-2 protease family protein [Mariniblastus fucicola]QEG24727.1 Peptidase family M50 [Mariniblastus fucicola]